MLWEDTVFFRDRVEAADLKFVSDGVAARKQEGTVKGSSAKALQNQSVTEDHRAALETKSQTYLQTAFFPAPLEF